MTKEEWQRLYDILSPIYSKFLDADYEATKGRNKAIRTVAERRVDPEIMLADSHISKCPDALILLADSNDDYTIAIKYDEFKKPWYFKHDMKDLLDAIKDKIESFAQ